MKYILPFLAFLIIFTLPSEAQLFKKKKEQSGQKTGKYTEYSNSDTTIVVAKGHFCESLPCKTWKYYYDEGGMRMKIKYRDRLKIKYYTQSGQLDQKGYAMLDFNAADTHFYWHGRWKYYDERRKLYRIALYENGEEVEVVMGPEDPIYYD